MTLPPPIREGLFVDDGGTPRLIAGMCATCTKLHFPDEGTCPYCGAPSSTTLVGPEGVLRLCTIVHRAPPGYVGPVPYGFGVVEIGGTDLEIVSRVAAPTLEQLRPGLVVRLALRPIAVSDGDEALTWTFEAEG